MKNIYIITSFVLVFGFCQVKAQQTPAHTTSETISIVGATAHIGDGSVIENAIIILEAGLIKEIGKTKTILLSTHIMQEVEAMCDRVLIINKGTLVTDKKLKDLITEGEQHIEVEFDLAVEEQLLRQLQYLDKAENIYDTTWSLVFKTEKDMRPELFDFANNNGLKALKINKKIQNLESMFREMTRNLQD